MPLGNYRHLAVDVREHANALAAVVIVLEGDAGNGFAVDVLREAEDDLTPRSIATMLRTIADAIELGSQAIQ